MDDFTESMRLALATSEAKAVIQKRRQRHLGRQLSVSRRHNLRNRMAEEFIQPFIDLLQQEILVLTAQGELSLKVKILFRKYRKDLTPELRKKLDRVWSPVIRAAVHRCRILNLVNAGYEHNQSKLSTWKVSWTEFASRQPAPPTESTPATTTLVS